MHGLQHKHEHSTAPATEGKLIRWAGQYDLFVQIMTRGRETALRENMIAMAGVTAGTAVLDVGCGTGSLTRQAKIAAGSSGRVCGIDAAPEMIEVARSKAAQKRLDVEFQVGVIEALPFLDATFDLILSSLMFHHLPGDLKRRGLIEMRRVLKPGGRIAIFDLRVPKRPKQIFSLATLAHLANETGVDELLSLVQQSGFPGAEIRTMRWDVLGCISSQRD